ncbi:MAG: hypothetical protein OEL89_03785, partial [Candidatus Peregrinibacteria bacterium]|nr:hypothetical protein [Candidatus Peregrinibacteria bacterium]
MQLSLSKTLTKPEILRIFLITAILGIFSGKLNFVPEYLLLIGTIFFFVAIFTRQIILGIIATLLLSNFYGQFRN